MSNVISNPAIKPGTNDYYALLMYAPAAKSKLVALHEVYQRMLQLLERPNEVQLHSTRLHWWLEQVNKFRSQEASLPALVTLQSSNEYANEQLANLLQQLLMAINEQFRFQAFTDEQAFNQFAQKRFSMLLMAELVIINDTKANAQTLNENQTSTSEPSLERFAPITQSAGQLMAWQYLYQFGHLWLNQGRCALADAWLKSLAIEPQLLLQYDVSAHQLFNAQCHQQMQNNWQDLNNQLKALDNKQTDQQNSSILRALVTRCKIMLNTMKKIERADYPLYDPNIDSLPLKKLWLAWRTDKQLS